MENIISSGIYSCELCSFQDHNGLFGFIDEDNNIIIKPKYKSVGSFNNGLCLVTDKHDRTYYIDDNGKKVKDDVIKKTAYIKKVFHMMDGYFKVLDTNDKYGFLNKDGEVIIYPEYIEASSFSNGVAVVKLSNNKYTIINKKNKKLTKMDYDYIYEFNGNYAITKRLVTTIEAYDDFRDFYLYGVIDKNGNEILPPNYLNIVVTDSGLIIYSEQEYGKFSFYKDGKVVSHQADKIIESSYGYTVIEYDGKYYIVDEYGNKLTFLSDDEKGEFLSVSNIEKYDDKVSFIIEQKLNDKLVTYIVSNGKVIFRVNSKDKNKFDVSIKRNNCGYFNLNMHKVGLISPLGKHITPVLTDKVDYLHNGLIVYDFYGNMYFHNKSLYGYKIKQPYTSIKSSIKSKLAIGKLENNNYVLIDSDGEIVSSEYNYIYFFDGGYTCGINKKVSENSNVAFEYDEYNIIDENGKVVYTLPNENISNINCVEQIKDNYFKVRIKDSGLITVIDVVNKKHITFECDDIRYEKGYFITSNIGNVLIGEYVYGKYNCEKLYDSSFNPIIDNTESQDRIFEFLSDDQLFIHRSYYEMRYLNDLSSKKILKYETTHLKEKEKRRLL